MDRTERELEVLLARDLPAANRCMVVGFVADTEGEQVPVACGFRAGHPGMHAWADLPGALSSKPPTGRGFDPRFPNRRGR